MSYEVPIERGKIREFATASKSDHAAYQQVSAVIPPTFLITAANFWATPADDPGAALGFDMRRVLHAEEEYVFHGPPPRAGDTLVATARLGEQYEKEGRRGGRMRFAVLVTEFRDETGAIAVERRTTVVETAQPPKDG